MAVGTFVEIGKRPPTGKVGGTERDDIRLSAEEKLVLGAAAGLGFRGISDFVRAAAIEKSSSG